jgi:hypothetical protein
LKDLGIDDLRQRPDESNTDYVQRLRALVREHVDYRAPVQVDALDEKPLVVNRGVRDVWLVAVPMDTEGKVLARMTHAGPMVDVGTYYGRTGKPLFLARFRDHTTHLFRRTTAENAVHYLARKFPNAWIHLNARFVWKDGMTIDIEKSTAVRPRDQIWTGAE